MRIYRGISDETWTMEDFLNYLIELKELNGCTATKRDTASRFSSAFPTAVSRVNYNFARKSSGYESVPLVNLEVPLLHS